MDGVRLDMVAAMARKDYEDRLRHQAQGQARAKAAGLYKGRCVPSPLGWCYRDAPQASMSAIPALRRPEATEKLPCESVLEEWILGR